MSATSGIPIHDDLQRAFVIAQNNSDRFLKLAIRNESIVLESTTPIGGDLNEDLQGLQNLLEDSVPAYVLARLDDQPSQWLVITYVPDSAKVRDKMLYASARTNLTKFLGSASFADALFATQKSDLTPAAYVAHCQHQTDPKPLSIREQEMSDIQAAERAAARSGSDGSTARKNHLGGAGVQIAWPLNVQDAVKSLKSGDVGNRLLVVTIDPATETLVLSSDEDCLPNDVGASLPSDPSYAFYAWSHGQSRDIVFIYSCPSTSPIKYRMIFSSGVTSVIATSKALDVTLAKKIETSEPKEINEIYLRAELGLTGNDLSEKKPFAKPRGPARRQR